VSYHNLNAGKRCITIDIRKSRWTRAGAEARRSGPTCAIESFTPGVLDELQLGYRELSARNDRLIMASTSHPGADRPDAKGTSGVGTMGAAMSGATHQIGWPDRAPSGAVRTMDRRGDAALHRREYSGGASSPHRAPAKGCYIDVAQSEAGMQFMMPAYYEFAANGKVPERRGVAGSLLRVPDGVYRCAGDDRWVAISASESAQFEALRKIVGGALRDARFDTVLGRLRNREAIDAAISEWTSNQESDVVESILQSVSIAAHIVSRGLDHGRDADLHHLGHLKEFTDAVLGEAEIEGPRCALERTPLPATRRGPRIGEHTQEVLETVLHLSSEEIAKLTQAGVLA
jgi:benzylsuccinate CoA-transferase BbsF subunit